MGMSRTREIRAILQAFAVIVMTGSTAAVSAILPAHASERATSGERIPAALAGRAIFEGVFFGFGPVAHRVSDIWQPTELRGTRLARRRDAVHRLEDLIERRAPGFFNHFQSEMQSGNPVLVAGAFSRGQGACEALGPLRPSSSGEPISKSAALDGTLLAAVAVGVSNTNSVTDVHLQSVKFTIAVINTQSLRGGQLSQATRFTRDEVISVITQRLSRSR